MFPGVCLGLSGVNMLATKGAGQEGTTFVEMAAILPILFALTFGMIDLGRYFYAVSAVTAAAQEGARAGLSQDGIVDLAIAEQVAHTLLSDFNSTELTINVGQPNLEIIEVEITYQFKFITPYLAPLFPDSRVKIAGGAAMAIY